eukprot:CAMPEP_0206047902 /NCGR_PEP_ID=MMETSP1466-20131121/22605_1 /ASSEMBLY_ACC=CAM_ASM_001126 /TAXON_ID=44452 /ORGANISM="Pavlova gyrans, Strain CCMP608" /LENGTH=441 /DNA_ID=CAMNT_0053422929 /DNA_START=46 /DNA_END=1371 /DNA_ORIENTATION=+
MSPSLRRCFPALLLASTLGLEQPTRPFRSSGARMGSPNVARTSVAGAPNFTGAADAGDAESADMDISTQPEESSPLWMITQDKEVTNLITYLQASREPIEKDPLGAHELHFTRSQIEKARHEFDVTLRMGEQKQHALCSLLGQRLLGRYYLQGVVVGELPRTFHRFELSQRVQPTTLLSETDLALGNRILSNHRVLSNGQWVTPALVASFVEYHPTVMNYAPGGHSSKVSTSSALGDTCIYKMISRIKAEQEIFNKVCDEIFDFDRLVRDLSRADKQLASLGHFVKDVFGIKLVVGSVEQAREVQAAIEAIRFTNEELAGITIEAEDANRLRFIEVKDHLGDMRKSNSGWECLKSVFEWNGGIFEVQIQPLINYCLERERLTKQSHDAFKQKRERARDQVASRVPLFGFYRDILRTLFVEPPTCDGLTIPKFNNVRVHVHE